ncbi:hypothetical protein [Maribacter sp. Hel_I_7]|uniref:hypothetical protein n=1 Tax=Maribacter sp. Hel_I_7 TaxID=1249997 RepID=UPI0009DE4F5B|nr:hypothetical protein [Maribacter sp. Hel_I_7]
MNTVNIYDALKQMRELTKIGAPFSFEYITFNSSKGYSEGTKKVAKALLRTGYSREQSDKSEILIGYTVEPETLPRWFYLPLLMKFNGMKVTP